MTFKLSDAFNIKPPRAIECVTLKKDDGRCDIEVEGHVDHVETGEPIKVKSHTVVRYPPTAEDFRSLLVTFWDHEVREQLHMDPHGPIDPTAVNVLRERDEAIARVAELENAVFVAATLAGPSKPGKRPPMATEGIYRTLCAVLRDEMS